MMGTTSTSIWRRTETPEGRIYYYNAQTKQTTWSRPEGYQPWREHTHTDGRKYYYNEETKETKWEAPPELRSSLPPQNNLPPRPAPIVPTFVAGGAANVPQYYPPRDRDEFTSSDRTGSERQPTYTSSSNPAFTSQAEPEYGSNEEAEAILSKLFKRVGVQPDWTWEGTMRACIKDPQFRAVKDPKDRKAAFEKYIVDLRAQEKDKEKERLCKLRTDFGTMLRSHPEIKHFSRWRTVKPIIEGETIYRSARNDDERRQLFEEYIINLKKANNDTEVSTRKEALEELSNVLSALDLEPYTRWQEAQGIMKSTEKLQIDDKFKHLTKNDTLKTFENHIKALERKFNDARQKEKNQKSRLERINRDNFLDLLNSLRVDGQIRAGTKWMDVHLEIQGDSRYTAMLGQAGSTPLDLFWDVVEEEERSLRGKRSDVLDVAEDLRFSIADGTVDEFMSLMLNDRRTANIDQESLRTIFERLQDKARKSNEEEKHHTDRHERRALDALRSRIKHLDPPVAVDDNWDQVRPRLEKLDEFRALKSDELRRSAFEKHIRRLKDREDDRDRDRSRRDHRDRDRQRERDRDYRNGHSDTHTRRHRSRSLEVDAYEADRKKAQADRERQYRKSSMGLSPPYRRDRDERDRYERSSNRSGNLSHYDRERREREAERERSYVSRADPRERGSELDYGDSRPGSVRRRRDSDVESHSSRRDTKRSRREKRSPDRAHSPNHRSRSPLPDVAAPKEDPGLRSGSEEGEIEED